MCFCSMLVGVAFRMIFGMFIIMAVIIVLFSVLRRVFAMLFGVVNLPVSFGCPVTAVVIAVFHRIGEGIGQPGC